MTLEPTRSSPCTEHRGKGEIPASRSFCARARSCIPMAFEAWSTAYCPTPGALWHQSYLSETWKQQRTRKPVNIRFRHCHVFIDAPCCPCSILAQRTHVIPRYLASLLEISYPSTSTTCGACMERDPSFTWPTRSAHTKGGHFDPYDDLRTLRKQINIFALRYFARRYHRTKDDFWDLAEHYGCGTEPISKPSELKTGFQSKFKVG